MSEEGRNTGCVTSDDTALLKSVAWLGGLCAWSSRWALSSPVWVPVGVRRAPLRLVSLAMGVHVRVWRCFHG